VESYVKKYLLVGHGEVTRRPNFGTVLICAGVWKSGELEKEMLA